MAALRRVLLLGALLAGAVGGAVAASAAAAPGDLDTSFGNGGLVRTPIHDSSHAFAIGRQSDGKFVVAGCSFDSSTSARFAVARYTSSGVLDTTFGEGGAVSVAFPESASCETSASPLGSTADLAIRPNDKIIVVGSVQPSGDYQDFAAIQLTSDGHLDGTFGNNGGVLLHPGDPDWHASARAIMLEPGGRAVIAGEARNAVDDGDRELSSFAAVRINADGTQDSGFAAGGEFVQELTENAPTGSGQFSGVADIVRYPDGRMALVGTAYDDWNDGDGSYRFRLAVIRLDANGQLDPSFSGEGKLVTPVRGLNDHARGYVAALGVGDRLTVGLRYDEHLDGGGYAPHPLVARFEEDGDPDPTFGLSGSALLDFEQSGDPHVSALAYQADGKLVLVGTGDGNFYFALARLTTTGALDTSFGTNGTTLGPPFGSDAWDRAWGQDLLLEPSGKIVVAGFATADTDPASHFALAQYEGDALPAPPPVADPPPVTSPTPSPPAEPRPQFTVRAIGDSVTAAFGYLANGSPVKNPVQIYRCRPPSPPDNRCSSPNKIAYPAVWARWHDLAFRNDAVSGSTPTQWLNGSLRKKLEATIADNPDLILLTLGANPMLTNFAFGFLGPERRCMRFDLSGNKTRECLMDQIKVYHVVPRLARIYRRLTAASDAHIGVLLYYATQPLTIPKSKARLLLTGLNAAVRVAIKRARRNLPLEKRRHLRLINPGPFSKHKCRARSPLIQEPWVLSVDSCIHPSRDGHRALARAVEATFGYLVS